MYAEVLNIGRIIAYYLLCLCVIAWTLTGRMERWTGVLWTALMLVNIVVLSAATALPPELVHTVIIFVGPGLTLITVAAAVRTVYVTLPDFAVIAGMIRRHLLELYRRIF